MRAAFALRINSGKMILNRAMPDSLRAVRHCIFTEGNSLSQSLTALPAPSGREPLARPGTLCFSQELYRHAKGPISEGAGIEQSEMTGGVQRPSPLRLCFANPALPRGEPLAGRESFRSNRKVTGFANPAPLGGAAAAAAEGVQMEDREKIVERSG